MIDWRELLLAAIRGERELDSSHLQPLPELDPADQLEIYRNAYTSRLLGALRIEANGLAARLGDDFDALMLRYIHDNPPNSWTLDHVANRLAGWMSEQGEPLAEIELARLDCAVQRGFSAGEISPVTPAALAGGIGALAVQPHMTVLRLRADVHRYRTWAISRGPGDITEAPEIVHGDFPLVVWRVKRQMRHWEIPLGLDGILDGLARGLGAGAAIEESWAAGWIPPDRVAESVEAWFRGLVERGIVGTG